LIGEVPDVRPYIRNASLVLNYVESGGGIALKVLEALAMRKAVLSNPRGCEGVEVKHGEEVFLAEGPDAFAAAAAKLLRDAPLRRQIAQKGYQKILEQYSWSAIASQFGRFYEALVSEQKSIRSVNQPDVKRLEEARGHATD
jgi:glycosyltransferase involved in cell wall biosynthesis